jgi:hypothetical protein
VLTGMSWVDLGKGDGPEPLLHINDPMTKMPPRMLLRDLQPMWKTAVIVH